MANFAIPLVVLISCNLYGITNAHPVHEGSPVSSEITKISSSENILIEPDASNLGRNPVDTQEDFETVEFSSGISSPLTHEDTLPLVTISFLKDVASISVNAEGSSSANASVTMENIPQPASFPEPEVSSNEIVANLSNPNPVNTNDQMAASIIVPIISNSKGDSKLIISTNGNSPIDHQSESNSGENEQISIVNTVTVSIKDVSEEKSPSVGVTFVPEISKPESNAPTLANPSPTNPNSSASETDQLTVVQDNSPHQPQNVVSISHENMKSTPTVKDPIPSLKNSELSNENMVPSLNSQPSQLNGSSSIPLSATDIAQSVFQSSPWFDADTQPIPPTDLSENIPSNIDASTVELISFIEKELEMLLQGKPPCKLQGNPGGSPNSSAEKIDRPSEKKKNETDNAPIVLGENISTHELNKLEDKIVLEVITPEAPIEKLPEIPRPEKPEAMLSLSVVLEQPKPLPAKLIALVENTTTVNSETIKRPNKTNAVNKPTRPRPIFGIQNNKTNGEKNSFMATNFGQALQSIPNLLKPIKLTMPGSIVPSVNWPSFTNIFNGLFKSQSGSNNESLPASLRLGGIENDCEEKLKLIPLDLDNLEKQLLCKSDDEKAPLGCSEFCVQNGFVQGDCSFDETEERYCVCHLIDDEKKFGLLFKHHKAVAENTNLLEPETDPLLGKCEKCSCSENCQKSGAYIGYCGNTCYCGTPWHDGSLSLNVSSTMS